MGGKIKKIKKALTMRKVKKSENIFLLLYLYIPSHIIWR